MSSHIPLSRLSLTAEDPMDLTLDTKAYGDLERASESVVVVVLLSAQSAPCLLQAVLGFNLPHGCRRRESEELDSIADS